MDEPLGAGEALDHGPIVSDGARAGKGLVSLPEEAFDSLLVTDEDACAPMFEPEEAELELSPTLAQKSSARAQFSPEIGSCRKIGVIGVGYSSKDP